MTFSVESPTVLSQDDLAYLESMFTKQGPAWEEIDAFFFSEEHLNALQDGYTSLFFLPEPDTTILMVRDLGIDGRSFQSFLALRHPLEARTLAALRLAPFDARSIAYVLLPYYRLRYPPFRRRGGNLGFSQVWQSDHERCDCPSEHQGER